MQYAVTLLLHFPLSLQLVGLLCAPPPFVRWLLFLQVLSVLVMLVSLLRMTLATSRSVCGRLVVAHGGTWPKPCSLPVLRERPLPLPLHLPLPQPGDPPRGTEYP